MQYCLFTEPQLGASYDDQLAFAQAADRLGFDGFFRSDHYLRGSAGAGLPGPTDAWTTLAGLARETSRVRLGTLVSSVTFRQPGILAIQVAQVDAMSDGRALPKPVQARVPVIIGGNGPRRTPALAARFATEFNLGFPPLDDIPTRVARAHAACERIGRDPATLSLSLAMSTFAGADEAEIER